MNRRVLTASSLAALRVARDTGQVHVGWNPRGRATVNANTIAALGRAGLLTVTKLTGGTRGTLTESGIAALDRGQEDRGQEDRSIMTNWTDNLKTMAGTNLDTLCNFLLGEMSPNASPEMRRVFMIALRDGRVIAGNGTHAGHVERVPASTIRALIARGLLAHCYGSEGQYGGQLSARVVRRRAELLEAQATRSTEPRPVTLTPVTLTDDIVREFAAANPGDLSIATDCYLILASASPVLNDDANAQVREDARRRICDAINGRDRVTS